MRVLLIFMWLMKLTHWSSSNRSSFRQCSSRCQIFQKTYVHTSASRGLLRCAGFHVSFVPYERRYRLFTTKKICESTKQNAAAVKKNQMESCPHHEVTGRRSGRVCFTSTFVPQGKDNVIFMVGGAIVMAMNTETWCCISFQSKKLIYGPRQIEVWD